MEFIEIVSNDFLSGLLFLVLLNDVHIVFLKALWHGVGDLVILLVLNGGDLVVSDQLGVLLLTYGEVVVAQTPFVSNLLGDELGVVTSWNALVYDFLLRGVT